MSDLKATIEKNNTKFEETYNRGDAKGVADLYTEKGRLYPPGADGKTFEGKDQIAAFWEAAYKGGVHSLKLTVDRVRQVGDMVIEESSYKHSLGHGRYIVVWAKENGEWKLDTDIFNV